MKPITIYALVDPRNNEVRYIGQAVNAARRFEEHQRRAASGTTLHDVWLRRLAELGLTPKLEIIEVLAPCTSAYAHRREKHWMTIYQAQWHDVLNMIGPGVTRTPRMERVQMLASEDLEEYELAGRKRYESQ